MDALPPAERLAQDLDRSYGGSAASNALECAELVESYIAERLGEEIAAFFVARARPAKLMPPDGFLVCGVPYRVIVERRDILSTDVLGILIAALHPPKDTTPPLRYHARLDGAGQYRKADLFLPPEFAKYSDELLQLSQLMFGAGYTWLGEFLRAKVRELESDMVIAVYRALRLAFSEQPQLADLVWLTAINDETGAYFFDQHVASNLITHLDKRRGKSIHSPVTMFFGLMTNPVPFEQMFSRHVGAGECLRCDLNIAEYGDTAPFYAIAEHVLYKAGDNQTKMASIFPIVRDKQPYLIAAFPTSKESQILPILRAHQNKLKAVFDQKNSWAASLLEKIRDLGRLPLEEPGKAGRFVGGIIKELLDD